MIGIVVREMSYLKVLQPIVEQLNVYGAKYILYHFDAPRGDKEYNRATVDRLQKFAPSVFNNAKKVISFGNDRKLLAKIRGDDIKKLVSLEVYLWAKDYIDELKKEGIKIYSILYLTDSLWSPDRKNITKCDRVYYSSEYLKNLYLSLINIKEDPSRDRWLGSPIYDSLKQPKENGLCVLMPNLRVEHVDQAIGGRKKFIKILENLISNVDHSSITFKTRKKQWIPPEVRSMGNIVDDGDIMYPPIISDIFSKTKTTIMFYSSGIYEAVSAGQYVINVPLNLKRWSWDQEKLRNYFESPLYNTKGVVQSISQDNVFNNNFKILPRNEDSRKQWLKKYIGKASPNHSRLIAQDILK